ELSALIASTVAAALAPVTERLGVLERRPIGAAAAAGPPPPRAAGATPALAPLAEATAPAGAAARRLLAAAPKRLGELGPSAFRPPPPPPAPIDVNAEDMNDTQAQLLLHAQALVRLMGSHGAGPSGDVAGPPGEGAGADVLGDLARFSSSSVGVRGSANRLRLQRALEAQPGALSLAVIRNVARRLGPLHAPGGVPDALEYWGRFGAFADNIAGRPAAYQATLTAIALNHLLPGEYDQATDVVALTMVAQEQATLGHERWTTAWLLTLQEDPPSAMLSRRTEQAPLRGFSALADPGWTTVALAYLKELDVLSNHEPSRHGRRRACWQGARARACNVIAMALIFMHSNRPQYPSRRDLGRQFSSSQRLIVKRIELFLSAWGRAAVSSDLQRGRQGFAILEEIAHLAGASGDLLHGLDPIPPGAAACCARQDFVPPELWLPSVEPRCLRTWAPSPSSWSWLSAQTVKTEADLQLQRAWDAAGPLRLARADAPAHAVSQVGNVFKDADRDRQIFDRLAAGPRLADLHVTRGSSTPRASALDRKDFYHQFAVSDARASTNVCGLARDLRAYADFPSDPAKALEEREEAAGRGGVPASGGAPGCRPRGPAPRVRGCFATPPMGDHAAVDLAQGAHGELLRRGGCLADSDTIRGMEPVPDGPVVQGLCIDDYFVVQRAPVHDARSEAGAGAALLAAARQAHAREELPESTSKVVDQELLATLVGAERRLALSALSFASARLKAASGRLLATLASSWIAVFAYRRPLMVVLDRIFKVPGVAEADFKTRKAEAAAKLGAVYGLSKHVRDELVLASVLAPMAVTDISGPYGDRIYAMDASPSKGAVVSTPAPADLVAHLWVALREIGQLDASAESDNFEGVLDEPGCLDHPSRPFALFYEFLEIGGGRSGVAQEAVKLGLDCGPVLDLSYSVWYDLRDLRLLEWILWLIWSRRVLFVMVEPPPSSFSDARRPGERSGAAPEGFDRLDPAVRLGNTLAFRCLALLLAADLAGLAARDAAARGLATPASAAGFSESWLASCAFGSAFKKELAFIGHVHPPAMKANAAEPALFPSGAAAALATVARAAVRRLQLDDEGQCTSNPGAEQLMMNEILFTSRWEVGRSWRWKRPAHINLLESGVAKNWLEGPITFGRSSAESRADWIVGGSFAGARGPAPLAARWRFVFGKAPALLQAPQSRSRLGAVRHRRGRGAFFDQSVFGGFPGEGWRAGLVARAVLIFCWGRGRVRGRPIGERTRGRRFVYLQWLDSWPQGRGYNLADLLEAKGPDVYLMHTLLEECGHILWRSGTAYYKLSETINAVSGRGTYVAYSWLDHEPGGQHVAMPGAVLRALVATALLWGWPRVGALLAAGWRGMLKPVEFLSAERGDLICPADVLHAVAHLRWSIREPKTKRLGPRAQSARIDDLQ
ncbi:unnamed protein product, partial [Prorocentrum cordatum]